MADEETRKENEQALANMTRDQETFMKEQFHMSKQDMIGLDEDKWEELLDQLFDIEIDDDNRASEKTAKHDKIVSEIIDMMESV